jgi:two-component system response regulator HydG
MGEHASHSSPPGRAHVLVVDDDENMCDLLAAALAARGWLVSTETIPERAIEVVQALDVDAVVTDLRMDGVSGVELCKRLSASRPDVPVVLLTAHGDLDAAVAALRVRAFDFLTKPPDIDALAETLERALEERHRTHDRPQETEQPLPGILGESEPMSDLMDLVERVSVVDAAVLIRGESGTGKELVARALHARSRRRDAPFVALNCAAIPETLVEAELFGHVKGAFTDARTRRAGLFELARGGTLFLDEIAELHLPLQPKLLRALQEKAIRPIGSDREVPVDVRLVTATNVDLADAVGKRTFRADLFYRLNVVEIVVPPLRERGRDVVLLAQHFLERSARMMGRDISGIAPSCAAKLAAYPWPGNVRELANVMERAVALSRTTRLTVEDLPDHVTSSNAVVGGEALMPLEELERRHIRRVMKATGGNKTRAAQILGVDRRTLYRNDWEEPGAPPAPRAIALPPALIASFVANRRRDVDTMKHGVETNDFAMIARIAHNMRGNGRSYGFPEVGTIGEGIEVAAIAKDAAGLREGIGRLEKWIADVEGRTGAKTKR